MAREFDGGETPVLAARSISLTRRQLGKWMASSAMLASGRRLFGSAPLSLSEEYPTTFPLRIDLGNPFYAWPLTLLEYQFAANASITSATHRLECAETKQSVPFQLSAGNGERDSGEGALLFVADLPQGATRTYRLVSGSSPNTEQVPRIHVVTDEHGIVIDTGVLQVRIPKSQSVSGKAPGPILQLAREGRWTGTSSLTFEGAQVKHIETTELEKGPVRSRHQLVYTLDTGATYSVLIECAAGMDYVRLREDMESLPQELHGAFEFAWIGSHFTHRQAPNHPYNFPSRPAESYNEYPWEPIAPKLIDGQFGVVSGIGADGRLPFNLRLFMPWSDPYAECFLNFWGENSSDAVSLFIDRMSEWQDHEYTIWLSSSRLAVEPFYRDGVLRFVWKLGRGFRSTCVNLYDHANDVEAMHRLEERHRGVQLNGGRFSTGIFPTSYALEQQNCRGTLDLNEVKNWQLDYTGRAPKPIFRDLPYKSASEVYAAIVRSEYTNQLALSGVRQNSGFGPVSGRQILESWVPGYERFRSQLSEEQRREADTALLLHAYVHAGETYMPMRTNLAGHPNFLSDCKSTFAGMVYLFPEHRDADLWSEEWEAYLRINTRYHTRPAVEMWGAKGGRWTENLGTYVWAFLRPASRASFLLKQRDGIERLCTPQLASMADWLVNALSAPFAGESASAIEEIDRETAKAEGLRRHYWGIVRPGMGPRRLHPPLGAHSERRMPARALWYLGSSLRYYSPLVAEYAMWASRPTDQDMEATADQVDPYAVMCTQPDNRGTNPHLATSKYTGYGITLRASVDTSGELSVHLMQIDDGPNYRWGITSEGGCGIIYFYANGKAYSHNGGEDAGDRADHDTDFCTNFGVWKNGVFRGIGQNVLHRPLYDLEVAQYAEIVPRQTESYSWPEYIARCILLAGDDYFLIHDQVFSPQINTRFSWFVRKGDLLPNITLLTGSSNHEATLRTVVQTQFTDGFWVEGAGDSLVIVTHKNGIVAQRAPFGATVSLPDGGEDLVFASQKPVEFHEGEMTFRGRSGIIRKRSRDTHIALFHGTQISAAGVSLATNDEDLGIAVTVLGDSLRGRYVASKASHVTISVGKNQESLKVYIDGAATQSSTSSEGILLELPAGKHVLELSATQPIPLPPAVDHTEAIRGGAKVLGTSVASATAYILELSPDGGRTWSEYGSSATSSFTLSDLKMDHKYHVRLRARNATHTSDPGPEYPVYVSDKLPNSPDGLHIELAPGEAHISWGEVLGISAYKLYRRKVGGAQPVVIYEGRETQYIDRDPAIVAGSDRIQVSGTVVPKKLFEYFVTSVNGLGEGKPSRSLNTDPNSWSTWNPTPGEPFRRTAERTLGALPNDGIGRYYPS